MGVDASQDYNGGVSGGAEALSAQVGGAVLKRVTEDDLVLPSLPWILRRAAAALGESPYAPAAVAAAVEPDPLAVARLMRVANSAPYSDGTAVHDITGALERLGPRIVRIFIDDAGCDRLILSRDPHINEKRRRSWEHGIAVALVARELAGLVCGPGRGELAPSAYVGGLLHDLGKPVMAALLLDSERRLASAGLPRWLDAEEWAKLVHANHATVGRLLAVKWGFPTSLRQCIADPYALDRWKPYATKNIVCLANALVERAGFDLAAPADPAAMHRVLGESPALMNLTDEQLARVACDLPERVARHVGAWDPTHAISA